MSNQCCKKCHGKNIYPLTQEELDAVCKYEHIFFKKCHSCGKKTKVSSKTGSCKKCDYNHLHWGKFKWELDRRIFKCYKCGTKKCVWCNRK